MKGSDSVRKPAGRHVGLHVEHLEPRLLMAAAVGVWTDGVATVKVYDYAGGLDTNADDIVVKFGDPGEVSSIKLGGDSAMTGVGILIGATSVGSIKDARKGDLGDLAYIAAAAPIKSIKVKSGVTGFHLNGYGVDGVVFPSDIDSDGHTDDLTAVYAPGGVGKISLGGSLQGDIWIGGADSKGVALKSFSLLQGDLLGEIVAQAGSVNKVTIAGALAAGSNVRVGGILKSLRAASYALDNGGTDYGLSAASYGKITFTELGLKLSENSVPYQDNDFVITDGDDQISEAHAIALGVTIKGYSVGSPSDVDMFSFTVGAGQTIGFDIDCPYDTDTYIRLFNATGAELANNDDGTAPGESYDHWASYMEYTFASGGTYYLGVSGLSNTLYDPETGADDDPGSTGKYTLTTTVLA